MLNNLDHGAIPAATTELQEELGLGKSDLGFLGSLVFVGLFFGSTTAVSIMGRTSYKTIMSCAFGLNGICLIFFAYC